MIHSVYRKSRQTEKMPVRLFYSKGNRELQAESGPMSTKPVTGFRSPLRAFRDSGGSPHHSQSAKIHTAHRFKGDSMPRIVLLVASICLTFAMVGCKTLTKEPETVAPKAPVLDRVFQTGILRVGMSGDQPPFNMTTSTGQIIGIEADLANALANSMGVRAEFTQKPFSELLGAVESGEVDIVLSQVTMTPARNTRVAFVGPYFISGKAILTRSKSLSEADEPKDINMTGIRLSALAGSTSESFIRQSVPSARLYATPTPDLAIQAVIDGKVDAMVADLSVCLVAALRHPNEGLITIGAPFTFEPIGAALPPNDPLFLNLVENYINILEGTGTMQELEAKWFKNPAWLNQLP